MKTTGIGGPALEEGVEEMEQDLQENSWLALITNLAENTGMHGLPNVSRHRNVFKKLFWLVILLAATGVGLWQIIESFKKFYSHPSETSVKVEIANRLQFPAVTFCNINPMRYSVMTSPEFSTYFTEFSAAAQPTVAPAGGNRTFDPDWATMEDDPSFYEESSEYAEEEDFLITYSSLSEADRKRVGHTLDDMLISCTFSGSQCGPGNFSHTSNAQYGNCYTINNGYNFTAIKSVNKPGPRYALELVLYIQQNEYVQQVSQSAGLRVVIHNATEMPFPQDVGFSVRPGTETYVAIKRADHYLTYPPYGICSREADTLNDVKNAWAHLDPARTIDYSSKACKYTCFQRNLMSSCGCYDPFYPNNASTFASLDASSLGVCNTTNITVDICVMDVNEKFAAGILGCELYCPPACHHVVHEREISQTEWPSTAYEQEVLNTIYDADEYVYNTIGSDTLEVQKSFIRANVLKLRIFFADLDMKIIETSPSYQITQLLSDIGGQTGLWLGFSVITMFELVELLWDIIRLFATKAHRKNTVDDLK